MLSIKQLKHDIYLNAFRRRVQLGYDGVHTNIPLISPKTGRKIAEIDLLAIKQDQIDVYEVKCSHRSHKAKKQLEKIKRIYPRVNQLFFFCGESGRLLQV